MNEQGIVYSVQIEKCDWVRTKVDLRWAVHELTADNFRAAQPQKGKKMYSISFQNSTKVPDQRMISALSFRSQNSIKVYLQITVANLMMFQVSFKSDNQLGQRMQSNQDSAWS